MKRIIIASQNKHKIQEIEAITKKFGMFLVPRSEAGIPDIEVEEDSETFEENSYKKARTPCNAAWKGSLPPGSAGVSPWGGCDGPRDTPFTRT